MGKWKCLWCSKVLEGESFMDLIEASRKEEGSANPVKKVQFKDQTSSITVSTWWELFLFVLCNIGLLLISRTSTTS